MSTLLFIDLDNVYDRAAPRGTALARPVWIQRRDLAWQPDLNLTPPARSTNAPAGSPEPDVVVVIAMNQKTVADLDLTEAALSKFAAASAHALELAAPNQAVSREICLTTTMPEAADVAMIRLLSEAPCPEHCGPFECVVLWSGDKGLRADFQTRLKVRLGAPNADSEQLASWRLNAHQRWQRKFAPPRQSNREIRPLDTAWSAPVVAGTMASAMDVTLPKLTSLQDILLATTHAPHVLSQVGVTQQSVRGVARLDERLAGAIQLTPTTFGEDEGLEVNNAEQIHLPGAVHEIGRLEAASIGNGAIRIAAMGTTCGCALPPTVAQEVPPRDVVASLLVGEHLSLLSSSAMLHGLDQGIAVGAQVRVTFRRLNMGANGSALQARVQSDAPDTAPAQWWVAGSTYTTRGEAAGEPGRRPLAAVQAVACRHGDQLVLRAAFETGSVQATGIACGEIESVTLAGSGEAVALLETRQTSLAGLVAVMPIQLTDRPSTAASVISDNRWRELVRLPLMVPCQIDEADGVYDQERT